VLSGQPSYASLCTRCLDCLEKCPQGLEIPDLLEQVVAQFEGEGLKEREAMIRGLFTA
jgi:predicted aldo/keto reductase-like oxidoreductase